MSQNELLGGDEPLPSLIVIQIPAKIDESLQFPAAGDPADDNWT